jgi:hypothetical protein
MKLVMVSVYFNRKRHTKFILIPKNDKPVFNLEEIFNIPRGVCVGR